MLKKRPHASVFAFAFALLFCFAYFESHAAQALPAHNPQAGLDPEIAAGKFEGDMLLTEQQEAFLSSPIQARNGLIDETKRWPDHLVYYKLDDRFDAIHREAIADAIEVLEMRTCLKFRLADNTQKTYVAITADAGGCFSEVGYRAKLQQMNLEPYPIGEGCFRAGSIFHEFMHVLGFYHEQSAPKRDEFIEVVYDNVIPEKEFNFKKYSDTVLDDFDVGYDYDSCMHYGPRAFSANGKDTIVPLEKNARIGQREGMSKKDIAKINTMYKCPIKV